MRQYLGIAFMFLAVLAYSAASAQTALYRATVRGKTYSVKFMDGGAATMLSPANGQTFSGTYTIKGATLIVDFGFGKEIYHIQDRQTLTTEWQGILVALLRDPSSTLALTADGGSKASGQTGATFLGVYRGIVRGKKYEVRFIDGDAFTLISPSNGQSFSGTYTIKGKTVIADMGFDKEIYRIANDGSLQTSWQGVDVILRK
jgi:hypothetical protein